MKTFIIIALVIAACFADNIMVRQAVRSEQKQFFVPNYGEEGQALSIVPARSYQMDFIEDSILIWDGNRYVGTIPAFDSSELCKLLWKDNE